MSEKSTAPIVRGIVIASLALAAVLVIVMLNTSRGAPADEDRRTVEVVVSPTPERNTALSGTGLEGGTGLGASGASTPKLPLSGRRIGLDPGHGPRDDLGSVLVSSETGELKLAEEEFNLDVALRTRDLLVERGAIVILTRETADMFTAPWPVDANGDGEVGSISDDLQQRIDILNNFEAEAFLSIHANGGMDDPPAEKELQVIYCGAPACGYPAENKRLGELVLYHLLSRLASVAGTAHGGSLLTDLAVDSSDPPEHMFVLGPVNLPRHPRAIAMPGVLAESLYVTSPTHAALLKLDSVRQAIALGYADALQVYLTSDR